MKYTLNLSQSRTVELEAERILTNDVTFPWEFNPHHTRLWVIGNEYGALAAVWAEHEADAIDTACDAGLVEALLVPDTTWKQMDPEEVKELTPIGNAGELADLQHTWMQPLEVVDQTLQFNVALAEARGAVIDDLNEL